MLDDYYYRILPFVFLKVCSQKFCSICSRGCLNVNT